VLGIDLGPNEAKEKVLVYCTMSLWKLLESMMLPVRRSLNCVCVGYASNGGRRTFLWGPS